MIKQICIEYSHVRKCVRVKVRNRLVTLHIAMKLMKNNIILNNVPFFGLVAQYLFEVQNGEKGQSTQLRMLQIMRQKPAGDRIHQKYITFFTHNKKKWKSQAHRCGSFRNKEQRLWWTQQCEKNQKDQYESINVKCHAICSSLFLTAVVE